MCKGELHQNWYLVHIVSYLNIIDTFFDKYNMIILKQMV